MTTAQQKPIQPSYMIVSDQKMDHSLKETCNSLSSVPPPSFLWRCPTLKYCLQIIELKTKEDLGLQCQAQHWLKYLCNLVQQWPAQTHLILAQLSPSLPTQHEQDLGPQCQINFDSNLDLVNLFSTLKLLFPSKSSHHIQLMKFPIISF